MTEDLFKDYQERIDLLDENIRELAVKYAEEFYRANECSKEEALERGIVEQRWKKGKFSRNNKNNSTIRWTGCSKISQPILISSNHGLGKRQLVKEKNYTKKKLYLRLL